MKKHNTHDSGYKMLFSNHEMVRQLLTSFVDEEWIHELEFESLVRIDKSFVSDRFEERESDIIYKVNFKGNEVYIFILLEFQSTVDKFMALRMLRYITELYEYLVRNHKLKKLPAVFPVMLYNGDKKWTAPEELDNLIENSIPGAYIPHFRYYKIAENEFDREFLIKLNNAIAALFYTENCQNENLQHEIDIVVELIRCEKPEEHKAFVNWFSYMFYDKPELVKEIKGIEEAKNMLRTTIKKYGDRIKQESLEEGIEKGRIDTARKLLKKAMPVQEIAEVTGLTVEQIEKLKDKD